MSNFREMYFKGEIDGKGLLDEIDRLRAELDNAAAAAVANMSLACEKEREADALRAEVEENEKVINVWRGRTQCAEAEVEAYRKDAARLNYIERTFSGMTNRERYLPVTMIWGAGAMGRTLRQAVDKYMGRESETGASA